MTDIALVFLPRLSSPMPAVFKSAHRVEYKSANTSLHWRGGTAQRTRSSYPHTTALEVVRNL